MGQEIGNRMDALEWTEDDFEGRYAIKLIVDTGNRETLLRLTGEIEQFARGLDALGFRLDVDYVIASKPRVPLGR